MRKSNIDISKVIFNYGNIKVHEGLVKDAKTLGLHAYQLRNILTSNGIPIIFGKRGIKTTRDTKSEIPKKQTPLEFINEQNKIAADSIKAKLKNSYKVDQEPLVETSKESVEFDPNM